MAWLVRGDEVLASLEVADSARSRGKGLLGRDEFDGALLLDRCRSLHSFGMRFDLDIAYLDADRRVLRTATLRRHRIAWPHRGARSMIEAPAGSFREWNLVVGDELEVR